MSVEDPWVLGIDFGTSFTVAAARGRRGPEVIEIGGERRVPSVVLAEEDGSLVVGRSAENLATAAPGRAIRAPKSRMGEPAPVILGGRAHQVTTLIASLLSYVYREAVRQQGSVPAEVRLTHPAAWSQVRLDRLLHAAAQAELPNPVLVPEPVAAAVSFAEDGGVLDGGYVAVYDLGGGTFDTAVLQATADGFVVVGRPAGEDRLGGDLFDELLANFVGSRLEPETWEALQISDERSWQQAAAGLRNEARRVKEALSSHPYAELLLGLPTGMVTQRVTRVEFESLVEPYVAGSVELLSRAVSDAGLNIGHLDAVYLAGGASRSPLAERLVSQAFPGVTVSRRGDPKTAVAVGATHGRAVASGAGRGSAPPHPAPGGSVPTFPPPPAPVGTVPVGTVPVGTVPVSTVPVGTVPVGTVPVGTPPVGSVPPGSPSSLGLRPGSFPPQGALPVADPAAFRPVPGSAPGPGSGGFGPPPAMGYVAPPTGGGAGYPPGYPVQGYPGSGSGPGSGPGSGRSNRARLISVGLAVVAVVLLVGVGGVVLARSGDQPSTNREESSTTASRSRSTREQATSSSVFRDTIPLNSTVPRTTRTGTTPRSGQPSAEQVATARLTSAEIGAGYVAVDYGPDEPFCEQPVVITSVLRASVAYESSANATRVDNDVQSFTDAALAAADLDASRALVEGCPISTATFDGVKYVIGILPYPDSPTYCDDTFVALQVAVGDTVTLSRAIGAVRCGRNLVSVGFGVIGREFSTADEEAFNALLEVAANRLAELPR